MTIEGYVREPTEGDTWATRQSTPKGYRRVIVDEFMRSDSAASNWCRLDKPRHCNWTVGPGHTRCRRRAVVAINRGSGRRRILQGYCEQHLYGRHWQDGRLLASILVVEDEQP